MKGIEKKIFAEHFKHKDLSELDAKVLYTKNARSLKTYGVTFFLVKVLSVFCLIISTESLFPAGEDEGQEQTGSPFTGRD